MKRYFRFSYLPPEKVLDGFFYAEAPITMSNTISIYSDYILENYITLDSNFSPKLWGV
jgi:hypothetical protein